jgi:hypothetical protein
VRQRAAAPFIGGARCLALKEPSVGVLCPATSIGGTRRRVHSGGSPDLELEGVREDTRHKIYTCSGSQSSYPTSC